ncbi:MAG: 50S ribosomal protein L17 [Planctomycetota bacterium]
MRHRIRNNALNRKSAHGKALRRNMAQNLIEHGRITTTLPKARNLRPFVEQLVTLAVKSRKLAQGRDPEGSLGARRRILALLNDRAIIPANSKGEYNAMSDAGRAKSLRMASGRRHRTGEPRGRLNFTSESVVHRLIETIAPKYMDRPGGYTRVIQLAKTRIGDSARLAIIQFVGDETAPTSLTKPQKSARKRRTDKRYSFAAKVLKGSGGTKNRPTAAEAAS